MKKAILVFILLASSWQLFSQTNAASFDWAFNTGGGFNTTKRMQYDSHGDLLFLVDIGNKTIFGGTQMNAINGFRAFPGSFKFLGKRTQDGTKSVLIKTNSGPGTIANFDDFTLDSNDNIIVSGTVFNATTPYDFGNGVTLLGKGYFVAKYNSSGQCQWAKLFTFNVATISSTNSPIALGVLPNNDIYFAARSSNGNNPFWLLRLDSSGTEIWHKEWILPLGNAIGIATSKNNCFFDATGMAYFYVTNLYGDPITLDGVVLTIPAGTHPSGAHILAIDGNGKNGLFTSHRGGIGDIAVEKSTGNLLLKWGQYVQNPAPFNTLPMAINGTYQYQGIIALDKNRNFLQNTPGPLLNQADIDAIFPLGNLKFVGSKVLQPTVTITAGSQSFTATKYTSVWKFFDNFVFSSFIAHPELNETSAQPFPLMAAYMDKLAVSGSFGLLNNPTAMVNGTVLVTCENDLTFGTNFPFFAATANDIFIAQITNTPSLGTPKNQLKDLIAVYPNPASGNFTIEVSENLIGSKAVIYNLLGQKIKDFILRTATSSQTLNTGMYLLEIEKEGGKITKKLIVN